MSESRDLLTFVEMEGFSDDWKDLRLNDDDLTVLQWTIMGNPKGYPVIPQTGGLRKVRFSPKKWAKGKRGSVRICYVYFERFRMVLLVVAYAKHERDDLSPQEKRAIKRVVKQIDSELSRE